MILSNLAVWPEAPPEILFSNNKKMLDFQKTDAHFSPNVCLELVQD